VHEAIAEVHRYAKALSPEGVVAISMTNDGKSRAIWRTLRQEFRWIDGILWQQKEPWPSYRIRVSRGHPGHLVGVLGLRGEQNSARGRWSVCLNFRNARLLDDSVNVEMGIGHVVSTSHGYRKNLKP
jgi:hypothetical protein